MFYVYPKCASLMYTQTTTESPQGYIENYKTLQGSNDLLLWHLTFSDTCCGSKECRHQSYIIQSQWNHELNVFKSCPHAIFYKWAKVHFVKKNEFTVLNSDFTNNYLQLAFIVVYATPPLTDGIITQSGFCPKAASHPLKSQTGKKQSTFFFRILSSAWTLLSQPLLQYLLALGAFSTMWHLLISCCYFK